jgi:hypothetical protein
MRWSRPKHGPGPALLLGLLGVHSSRVFSSAPPPPRRSLPRTTQQARESGSSREASASRWRGRGNTRAIDWASGKDEQVRGAERAGEEDAREETARPRVGGRR